MLKPMCNCGRLLADIQLDYEENIKKINENIKMNDGEKVVAKKKLLDKYHLIRYCCRAQLLGYVDLVEILI